MSASHLPQKAAGSLTPKPPVCEPELSLLIVPEGTHVGTRWTRNRGLKASLLFCVIHLPASGRSLLPFSFELSLC